MLTKVEALTPQGQTLTLSLMDPSNGFIVEEIEGLDPVKATIVTSPQALLDGVQYQASRREMRNIVLRVGLDPDYASTTVRELRSTLYRYFMPKSMVELKFFLDDVHFVSISARVESCESPMFTAEPLVNVSLLCPDPDFAVPVATQIEGATSSTVVETGILYPGTSETGILLRLFVDRTISQFTVYNRPQGAADFQMMEFAAPLVAGDEVEISTVAGNKSALLHRGGSAIPIMYGVSPSAAWVNLFPGQNWFRVTAEGAPIPYTIEYTAKYGGL